MKLSTLQAWRQVYLAETGLVAGVHLSSLGKGHARNDTSARPFLRWAHRTLLLGAALWLMHDIAHRRRTSLAGDLLALAGCALGLALNERSPAAPNRRPSQAAAALLALAGTIRSSAFPELE